MTAITVRNKISIKPETLCSPYEACGIRRVNALRSLYSVNYIQATLERKLSDIIKSAVLIIYWDWY